MERSIAVRFAKILNPHPQPPLQDDRHELERRVDRLLEHGLNIRVPSFDADLIESAILDSLSVVELLVQLEVEFGVVINIEELELSRLSSVKSIAELVAETRNVRPANA